MEHLIFSIIICVVLTLCYIDINHPTLMDKINLGITLFFGFVMIVLFTVYTVWNFYYAYLYISSLV